ncbi:MAG: prepilin-type N-terminal cleavage/methylation domain-containing protein [Candidatus Colwellbacteria bacterium]|nr:prepilin-type N-terminal cleavage/methylation domain-containing protein [Candidatus Colwellbacteria bacterium]
MQQPKTSSSVLIEKKESGFTLIEMVIVIAVVGILMGIAFNGIRGVQSSARDTKRVADLRSVQSYLELYFNKCGHYPGDAACGVAPLSGTSGYASMKSALEGSVANTGDIPDDPFAGRSSGAVHYEYYSDSNNELYIVGATTEKIKPRGGFESGSPYDCTSGTKYCVRS